MLNALSNEEKAIVTDIAGTTRDIVENDIILKGIKLHLLDTAGIRQASDKVESIGVERAVNVLNKADLVLVVLDSSSELDEEDQNILKITANLNRIVVFNKADIGKKHEGIVISAKDNDLDALLNEIYSKIGIDEEVFKTPALNNARQLGLLEQSKQALLNAKNDALNDLTVDLISTSLLEAYTAILEIVGEANQIDLAKEIFSRFCVGK